LFLISKRPVAARSAVNNYKEDIEIENNVTYNGNITNGCAKPVLDRM